MAGVGVSLGGSKVMQAFPTSETSATNTHALYADQPLSRLFLLTVPSIAAQQTSQAALLLGPRRAVIDVVVGQHLRQLAQRTRGVAAP